MRANDRIVLIVVPLLALLALFWFVLIAPKRNEASELQTQIDTTNAAIDAAESKIAIAEKARKDFPKNYGDLVKLGRAVPEDDDQSTLVYDMAGLGKQNKLNFRSFEVVQGTGNTAPPEPAPVGATPADAAATEEAQANAVDDGSTAQGTPQTVAVPATEAAAALLPIGAQIGPAGLPVTPYQFKYTGSFFDVSGFLGDVDGTVTTKSGKPVVHGRLMTIDGFSLTGDPFTGFPRVEANFAVTTYIVPAEQGLAGGATPAGPAPIASGSPSTVADTGDSGTTPTPTAAATP